MNDLTDDEFLGGRLRLRQPARGFRAGVDPVFLAASVPAKAGQSVLELGCGAGAAILCLGARVQGLTLCGLELQPEYADLCRENATRNGIKVQVETGSLTQIPDVFRARSFDHVIANPPYFLRSDGTAAPDAGRDTAMAGETPLAAWVDAATRRLAPKGWFTMIQRVERLPEILSAMDDRLGAVQVLPLVPRIGRAAKLVLVRARKGARTPFTILPPLCLHQGERHEKDGESYTPDVAAVLRDGAAMPWNAG